MFVTTGSKKSPLPDVDSPARNTRGAAKKSPLRSPAVDSPARNTRSAKRRGDSPGKPSSATSPARSLFNSPSEIDVFQEIDSDFNNLAARIETSERNGPFSGGRNRSSKLTAAADKVDTSESTSSSLSKEYPFLSLSPNDNAASSGKEFNDKPHSSESTADIEGTQTFMFGELMQDIEKDVAKGREGEGENGEIAINTKHSRNKRRETADTVELMGILSDAVQDDNESPKTSSAAANKENGSPHTPSAMAPSMTSKTPKSILSSKKRGSTRPKRNVEFGSPEAAEYNVGSPSVSMTPMHPESVRERYVMPDDLSGEEQTTELEGDLERLIAKGNDTSIMLDPIDELDGSKDVSGSSGEGMSFAAGAERTEELETNMLHLVDNRAEESAFSLPSISSVSSGAVSNHSHQHEESNDISQEDMSIVEPTQTVELEGTVASLIGGHGGTDNSSKAQADDNTQTMQLEGTLASLLDNRHGRDNENDITLPSLSSTSTPPVRNDGHHHMKEDSQTMNIEGTMASLLEAAPDNAAGDLTSQSQTLPLDNNLEVLVAGSRNGYIPREDDTLSTLGMNTASHELRHERELSKNLVRNQVVNTPPEPVNLKLDEVVDVRGINWGHKVETNHDIFLEALGAASANACSFIKPESEKVLTMICEEIEEQIQCIDNDSHYMEILQNKEELMRSLQQKIRADVSRDGGDDSQASLLLQSQIEAQFFEWNNWLTDVAGVYHAELSESIIPELQKDKSDISDKASLIDQKREQVALPLLIRSARRATALRFERTKGEVLSCEDEVADLEAQVEKAERQLELLQSTHEKVNTVAKSNEKVEGLRNDEKGQRQTADSSYFKFFSIERLHNWVLTGSSDSFISIVFRGLAAETSIQLSFAIGPTSTVTVNAKFGSLPRSTNSFMSVTGVKQTRFHPAVSGFLKSKMDLLCQDMKRSHISDPSEISSMIHFAELRVARIEQAAKELDTVLNQCRNSFLQPR